MVLMLLNSTLSSNSLSRNPHLVYALLYQQELFHPYRLHPQFGPLVDNVEKVVSHFNRALEKGSSREQWSQDIVQQQIRRACPSWKSNVLTVSIGASLSIHFLSIGVE